MKTMEWIGRQPSGHQMPRRTFKEKYTFRPQTPRQIAGDLFYLGFSFPLSSSSSPSCLFQSVILLDKVSPSSHLFIASFLLLASYCTTRSPNRPHLSGGRRVFHFWVDQTNATLPLLQHGPPATEDILNNGSMRSRCPQLHLERIVPSMVVKNLRRGLP